VSVKLPSRISTLLLAGIAAFAALGTPSSFAVSGQQKAWAMFEAAAQSGNVTQRSVGIRALGLLRDNARARKLAKGALTAAALEAIAERGDPSLEEKIDLSLFDVNSRVRFTAAATVIRLTALGRKTVRKDTEKRPP
jgi:hypothetical protein